MRPDRGWPSNASSVSFFDVSSLLRLGPGLPFLLAFACEHFTHDPRPFAPVPTFVESTTTQVWVSNHGPILYLLAGHFHFWSP